MNRWMISVSGAAIAVLVLNNCKSESRKQAPVAPAQNCPPGYVYSPNGGSQTQNPYAQPTGNTWNQTPNTTPIAGQQSSSSGSNQNSSGYTGYQLNGDGLALQQSAITWQQIQPIVTRSCSSSTCHSAQARAGGYDLSSYQATRNSGSAVVASVQLNARKKMPPNASLPQSEIQLFNLWQQSNFQETAGVGGVTGSTGSTGSTGTGYTGSTGYTGGTTGYNSGNGYTSNQTPSYGNVNNTSNTGSVPQNCVPAGSSNYR
jgi:hypothetical protein